MKPMTGELAARLREAYEELKALLESGDINNPVCKQRGLEICDIILKHYTKGEQHE
jgi:hypothetical protein